MSGAETIRCSSRGEMIAAWLMTAAMLGLSWPLLLALEGALDSGSPLVLLALLFPLAGMALLVWAVRATLRWRRFGSSLFELTAGPGRPGGELAGRLHVRDGLAGVPDFRAKLACVERSTRGAGRTRSNVERVLWSEELPVAGRQLAYGPHGWVLPLRFALPADARPTEAATRSRRVLWRLRVSASLPGADFRAQFEVPVAGGGDPAGDGAVGSPRGEHASGRPAW